MTSTATRGAAISWTRRSPCSPSSSSPTTPPWASCPESRLLRKRRAAPAGVHTPSSQSCVLYIFKGPSSEYKHIFLILHGSVPEMCAFILVHMLFVLIIMHVALIMNVLSKTNVFVNGMFQALNELFYVCHWCLRFCFSSICPIDLSVCWPSEETLLECTFVSASWWNGIRGRWVIGARLYRKTMRKLLRILVPVFVSVRINWTCNACVGVFVLETLAQEACGFFFSPQTHTRTNLCSNKLMHGQLERFVLLLQQESSTWISRTPPHKGSQKRVIQVCPGR